MVKSCYTIIFTIIKKIRGIPLTDLPNNWIDIMQSFEHRQKMDKEGLQMAEQLLKETSGYLRLIGAIDGKELPAVKYIVASNSIASNALDIISEVVERTCRKVWIVHLDLYDQVEICNTIYECQIVLQQIEKLLMIDQNIKRINEIKMKLAEAEKQVNIFLATSESTSSLVASHTSA